MRDGFIKVAAGTPKIQVADCRYNAEQIFAMMREAEKQGVRVLCLPELCLTGATCGDLFYQDTLLKGAEEGLATILEATKNLDMVTAVGLPVRKGLRWYSGAAVIHKGRRLGLVTAADCAQTVFSCEELPDLTLGVALGGEGTAPQNASLVLFPTARPALVGSAEDCRRQLTAQSSKLACAYVRADAGDGESTTDMVYVGHNLIVENGRILAERRFATGLTCSEIDVGALAYERRRRTLPDTSAAQEVTFSLETATTTLTRHISPTPFIPEDPEECKARCDEILMISALGLKKRLEHTGAKCAVVGLSGGLDSTLAILTTAVAMKLLDRPTSDILAVTMPCFGTTERTRDNAMELAQRLGATLRRIDLSSSVKSHFKDIGQSMENQDVTFENAQARERTQVLMDLANQYGGLVVGTGDLSELALGWCTYNGDHMSMYAVNADIPKTLMRHMVSAVAGDKAEEDKRLSDVLTDILDTPVSPELLPAVNGTISQKTEDLVGPYELHDFFLYYIVRWGFSPRKVLRLAEQAFARRYDRRTILKWLRTFCRRFFSQQFKRSCMPDGPAVGSVGLSPRGGWTMPSDAVSALWLDELEEL